MSDRRSSLTQASLPSLRRGGRTVVLTIQRDMEITMRDGAILRADLWLPATSARHPLLLQRTPYDKSFAPVAQGRLDPATAVARGYGVMIQDVRGRFASEGTFEPFVSEQRDGADTIAWITRQPFSDGRVAMYGASYPGAVQLLAAASTESTGLKAIVPDVTTSDFHGWMYHGGALQLGFALSWARSLAGEELERRAHSGADVAAMRERLDAMLADLWAEYWRLPVADQPLLEELVPAFSHWLAHPLPDVYWQSRSQAGLPDRVAIPSLRIAGWHDVFLRGALAEFTRSQQVVCGGQRLLIGPWAHSGLGDAVGEVIYGPGASRYELDLTRLHVDFFDSALSASSAQAPDPPVRMFTMGVNRWREEDKWPPAAVRTERLYLRAERRLTRESPAPDEATLAFVYDPRDPVPTTGGATFMPGHEASIALGPRDQRALHARKDVIVYLGDPLIAPVEVTGHVSLVLHAATSAPDTDWTAKLLDVEPEGRALGITDGIIRARYSQENPQLLEPGRAHRFLIDLGPTSIVLGAGHRIGLEVSSSNFPRFDRNPNSAVDPVHARPSDLQVATQRLHHDAERASFLELPVRK